MRNVALGRFVIVSGLPASGKTTLARRLSRPLGLPVIDKDDILESLFESKGAGDAARRRQLSRESDAELRARAESSGGAILVSFWHGPGMAADSGTPTRWLLDLPGPRVHVACRCAAEIAHARFARRTRHPGHLDRQSARTLEAFVALERALHGLHEGAALVRVDTSRTPVIDEVTREIEAAFARGPA
jgi:chloramphenicol 3-O-phosphotransferase